MTEHKQWLWRRKSSSDKGNAVVAGKPYEEIRRLLLDKAELERNLEDLRDRLSAAVSECNDKDELAKTNAETAQEALAGWEKAEATILSLKQELGLAIQAREASEARTSQLDAALKECMQQLHFVREQQENRIHDALTKALHEFQSIKLDLEEKLRECGEVIGNLGTENDQFSQILLHKERLIDDLNRERLKADDELSVLLGRLESTEKDKETLKYEVRLLEKELDIRNEERDFNKRATDAAHKQHFENVKKIARLESECQRLRVLVKKRLPGPAAIAKMKNEVEMLERSPSDNRRRKLHGNPGSPKPDYELDTSPENLSKKISLLIEKLCSLEEENSSLKESLHKKTNELQSSRNLYVQAAARLFQAGSQLENSPEGQKIMALKGNNRTTRHEQIPSASVSDVESDAGSWACALITELEHFRDGKQRDGASSCKSAGMSDMSVMDDFVEMEKLALVCVDEPTQISCHSTLDRDLDESPQGSTWKSQQKAGSLINADKSSYQLDSSEYSMASRKSPKIPSVSDSCTSKGENVGVAETNLKISVSKLVDIIEGIKPSPPAYDTPAISHRDTKCCSSSSANENPGTATAYTFHVFEGKTCDLDTILQSFLHTCNDLLSGKANVGTFIRELNSTLEWIITQCSPLKRVSDVKDMIKKLHELDEYKDPAELDACMVRQLLKVDESASVKEQVGHYPLVAAAVSDGASQEAEPECISMKDEQQNFESAEKESEDPLQHQVGDSNSSSQPPHKAETALGSLRAELEGCEPTNGRVEDAPTEGPISYSSAARVELIETQVNISSSEAESVTKSDLCNELMTGCRELQPESAIKIGDNVKGDDSEKQLSADQEILAASEKLVQCQETILNLGKQLKALASPKEAALFDKLISIPSPEMPTVINAAIQENKKMDRRSSLRDRMLSGDDDFDEGDHQLESREPKEIVCDSILQEESGELDGRLKGYEEVIVSDGRSRKLDSRKASYSLAIVPSRKKDEWFFKKLLWRRKEGNNKKLVLAFPN